MNAIHVYGAYAYNTVTRCAESWKKGFYFLLSLPHQIKELSRKADAALQARALAERTKFINLNLAKYGTEEKAAAAYKEMLNHQEDGFYNLENVSHNPPPEFVDSL